MLDLMLPAMDGFEFLKALRLTDLGRTVPVIVVTARDLDAAGRLSLPARVAAVLEKRDRSARELAAGMRNVVRTSAVRCETTT